MKKKLTITIASILSVIVIIGVGFAAWVITNPKVEDTADGSISVETVTDKSYTLTAAISNGAISFGAPKNMDTANAWLKAEGGNSENLEATLTLTLNYKDWSVVPENLELTIETGTGTKDNFTKDTTSKYESLVSKNIVTNPKISYDTTTTATPVEVTINGKAVKIAKTAFGATETGAYTEAKTVTLEVKIAFGWGSAFKGNNPYVYYNALDYKVESTKANENLTALYNALNGVNYKVTVTGTTAAA